MNTPLQKTKRWTQKVMSITGKFMNKRETWASDRWGATLCGVRTRGVWCPRCEVWALSAVYSIHCVRCLPCACQWCACSVCGIPAVCKVPAVFLQCARFGVCSVCSVQCLLVPSTGVWCLLWVRPWDFDSDLTLIRPGTQLATSQWVHLKTGRKKFKEALKTPSSSEKNGFFWHTVETFHGCQM